MALHIGSGGDLHLESSGLLICITVRGLERVTGLFVFTSTKARVLGGGQEIAAASVSVLRVVKDAAGNVSVVFRERQCLESSVLEGNCDYGATHWVWG